MRVHLKADAVPATFGSGNRCGAGSHKWIEYGVADEAEHSNQTFGQLGIWSRVVSRGSARDSGPDLLKLFLRFP